MDLRGGHPSDIPLLKYPVEVAYQKSGIFVVAQQRDIPGHGRPQEPYGGGGLPEPMNDPAGTIIEQDGKNQNQDIALFAPAIKKKTGGDEYRVSKNRWRAPVEKP
jgi:hypothetical protein